MGLQQNIDRDKSQKDAIENHIEQTLIYLRNRILFTNRNTSGQEGVICHQYKKNTQILRFLVGFGKVSGQSQFHS